MSYRPLVRQVELTFTPGAEETSFAIEHFANAVPDAKVGAVHVTRDDEQHCDRQVVMRDVRQPQGLSLRMEPTQEGEDRRS